MRSTRIHRSRLTQVSYILDVLFFLSNASICADTFYRRHIQQCHRINATSHHRCLRCQASFESQLQLTEHMTQALACEVQNNSIITDDPEDGITDKIQERLRGRGHGNRVNTWKGIWHLLFPEDPEDNIPHPCAYHQEVLKAFARGKKEKKKIKDILTPVAQTMSLLSS